MHSHILHFQFCSAGGCNEYYVPIRMVIVMGVKIGYLTRLWLFLGVLDVLGVFLLGMFCHVFTGIYMTFFLLRGIGKRWVCLPLFCGIICLFRSVRVALVS